MSRWILSAALVSTLTIAGCVSSPVTLSAAPPPRLEMPATAMRPCTLHLLPDAPTEADLDLGLAARGANLVACDAARSLAVQTWAAEHELQDRRLTQRRGWFGRKTN